MIKIENSHIRSSIIRW